MERSKNGQRPQDHGPNGHRLKGALVGYGFIGSRGHVPAYLKRKDVDIVAVVDGCAPRRSLAAQQLPRARIFESVAELFASGTHLDFIDVATPPSDHFEISLEALRRGIHVLCEKPLTTTAAHARALVDVAADTNRVVFPCHNYRFAPTIRTIDEIIASGRIGRVRSVGLTTLRPTHAKGVPEWNPDWRRQRRWSGGGIAMDHGSHTFYLAFDWLASWPTALTAKTMNQEPDRWDTEDDFAATLTFPGARTAHVHMTWTAGARAVIYTIHGEHGAIIARDDDVEVVVHRSNGHPGEVTWDVDKRVAPSSWMDASHTEWFNAMFDRFLDAVESRDFSGEEVLDACQCINVIEEAYASAAHACIERTLEPAPGFEVRSSGLERGGVGGAAAARAAGSL
jgi:predicted dehydrogenase